MLNVTVSLQLNDDLDPPTAVVNVQIDGNLVAAREVTPVDQWIGALTAVSTAADHDIASDISATITNTLARLQASIDSADAAQAARRSALQDWTAAASATSTP